MKFNRFLAFFVLSVFSIFLFSCDPNVHKADPSQTDSKMILFYSNSCPHCRKVRQFIKDNHIDKKVSFTEKELSVRANGVLLFKKAKICNITGDVGIPFLWTGNSCIMGDAPVMAFFNQQIKKTQ